MALSDRELDAPQGSTSGGLLVRSRRENHQPRVGNSVAHQAPHKPVVSVAESGRVSFPVPYDKWPEVQLNEEDVDGCNGGVSLGLDDLRSFERRVVNTVVDVMLEGFRARIGEALVPVMKITTVTRKTGDRPAVSSLPVVRWVMIHSKEGESYPKWTPRGDEKVYSATVYPNAYAEKHSRRFANERGPVEVSRSES